MLAGMPPSRHVHLSARRRDAGLRRISSITRGVAATSLALGGAFVALAARSHTGSKATARPPATTPATATAPAGTTPTAPPGTLPPDTFPSTGVTVPPTAAPLQPPATAPQGVQQTAPPYVAPPITSAPS